MRRVMSLPAARDALISMTDANSDPVLTSADLDRLLSEAKVADANGNPPDTYADWQANTAYAVGAEVVPSPRNGHLYRCTVAGTSGAVQPAFPTATGATLADGTATWIEDGATSWTPSYDVDAAAVEGWTLKAGRAAARIDFSTDGQQFSNSQVAERCLAMAQHYARRVFGTLRLSGRPPSAKPLGNISSEL